MRLRFHRDSKVYRHAIAFEADGVLSFGNAADDTDLSGFAGAVVDFANLRKRGLIENQARKLVASFKKSVVTGK